MWILDKVGQFISTNNKTTLVRNYSVSHKTSPKFEERKKKINWILNKIMIRSSKWRLWKTDLWRRVMPLCAVCVIRLFHQCPLLCLTVSAMLCLRVCESVGVCVCVCTLHNKLSHILPNTLQHVWWEGQTREECPPSQVSRFTFLQWWIFNPTWTRD